MYSQIRTPNVIDSVMQFLSQKSRFGLSPTASVFAHAKTEINCWLITNHRHFCFCVRRNGSWFLTNHRSQSRDEWSPYCLRNSTSTSCAYTQLAIFGNKIFGMVSFIPGSSLLWNFFHCQIGSTLEKQFSPLSLWEILLWALIPHQKTPDHSIGKHVDLLINRSVWTVKTMDQTSYWIFLQALWSIR